MTLFTDRVVEAGDVVEPSPHDQGSAASYLVQDEGSSSTWTPMALRRLVAGQDLPSDEGDKALGPQWTMSFRLQALDLVVRKKNDQVRYHLRAPRPRPTQVRVTVMTGSSAANATRYARVTFGPDDFSGGDPAEVFALTCRQLAPWVDSNTLDEAILQHPMVVFGIASGNYVFDVPLVAGAPDVIPQLPIVDVASETNARSKDFPQTVRSTKYSGTRPAATVRDGTAPALQPLVPPTLVLADPAQDAA